MRLQHVGLAFAAAIIGLATTACDGVFKFSDTGVFGFGDSADPFGGVDGSTDEDGVNGTITGLVTVVPFDVNDDGDIETVDWESMGGFPYGNIFVSAFTTDELSGATEYHAQTTILGPSTDGDPYELTVDVEDASAVNVYAALDFYGDGVIGASEPIGVYPEAVTVVEGDIVTDVNITIMAEARYAGGGGGDGGCCGEGDGDGDSDCITISGLIDITVGYAGGEVGVMLQDPSTGDGPVGLSVAWDTPQGDADGAEGDYAFSICGYDGEANLIGGWDSNYNRLLEPSDRWGAYSIEGEDSNPVTLVPGVDLEDHTVEIPLGDSSAFEVVPMVHLTGEITMSDGSSLDSLPTHSTVYIAALKYRPSGDVSTSSFDDAYDFETYDWADLSKQSSVDFDLIVPSNTTLYLWAYADTDGDGLVNESGEPISSADSENGGRLSVGSSNQTGFNMQLQAFEVE